ncbi:ABC transporter permease subunit [Opitutia bacterium ISCC 51]|nr:ABC transporter permease subunit [Opitutae bacterium ISCC 51]QXD26670.1 ABC transporter permease subunit [Opitutae bacterium ISCC 52]
MSTEITDTAAMPLEEETYSLWGDAWHRLKENRLAFFGMLFFTVVGLLCFLAPVISLITGLQYDEQNLQLGASAPSWSHWLGTDDLGRDLFIRILYGGRVSIGVGFAATCVSIAIGVTYGAIAGYLGKKTDMVMMRIVDILYSLPFLIFVILLTVYFGRNIILLFVAIGCVEWLTLSRIVRGQVLHLKVQQFVEVALTLGSKKSSIIKKHLIPNVLGPVIVYSTLTVPSVMLLESALSFLGMGVQPPMSSWGSLIKDGAERMEIYPWQLIFPALLFSMTLFSLNFFGDGLRDALDPKDSRR